MPADQIRYDVLVQQALRGMVRDLLSDTAKQGLPGGHHFFITFDTTADGVRLSDRLRAQYPEEMTVVLQHQFWELKVTDEAFEVGLSFGGVAEKLRIPFEAVKAFADPSVQFTLQFEMLEVPGDEQDEQESQAPATAEPKPEKPAKGKPPATARGSAPPAPVPAAEKPGGKTGAEVVRLDRFRKK
jgi:hypothetical protein